MESKEVKITKLRIEGKELSKTLFKNCKFCQKTVKINPEIFDSCVNIGGSRFYCSFCLRHNFHHKTNKNILIYSFRSVIGYYYYKLYLSTNFSNRKFWLNQIKDLISSHADIGLTNPVLTYDSESLLWFADFNRIGVSQRKAPYKDVKSLIKKSYDVFDVGNNVGPYSRDEFWKKFEKALDLFYQKRQRPKYKSMLIPTLTQNSLMKDSDKVFYEKTRIFDYSKLLLK